MLHGIAFSLFYFLIVVIFFFRFSFRDIQNELERSEKWFRKWFVENCFNGFIFCFLVREALLSYIFLL